MKPNVTVRIVAVSLLSLAVFLFISHRIRSKKLNRQILLQSAEANFLKQPENKNVSIDSTYISNDTLFYFGKGTFIGQSVIVTE